jgi:rubrerythrin
MRHSLARVFCDLLATFVVGSCALSCGPLFGCMNGVYGPPHYRNSVKELPEDLQARFTPGYLPDENTCRSLCAGNEHCQIASIGRTNDKAVVCHVFYKGGCPDGWGSGRWMEGLPAPSSDDALERMAYLEAASVLAFEDLARELARRHAPRSLIERALEAAADERRHAQLIAELAGCDVPVIVARSLNRDRSILELAIENAVEGCTVELFGALLLTHQSMHAAEARVREVLQSIARDEQAHAELALDLHAYFLSQLSSDEEREEVEIALRDARRSTYLAAEDKETAAAADDHPLRFKLGLPSSDDRRRLAYALFCEDPASPVYSPPLLVLVRSDHRDVA